jgi:predicted branched-subunit amino acid permease
MQRDSDLRAGIRAAVPLLLPTVALGASFGILARPVMGPFVPVVMSLVVFAGSSQFAALGVLQGGGAPLAAITSGLLMNARWLPMSFAIAPSLRGRRLRRAAEAQAIVDASFVLASRRDGTFDRGLLLGSAVPQALAWTGGTLAGVLAGGAIADPDRFGLDAIFPAFYLAVLIGEARSPRARAAAAIACLITTGLMSFTPAGVPVIAASAAALIGLRRARSGG